MQDDLRVFPASGDAGSIVECLVREAQKLDVEIKSGMPVRDLEVSGNMFRINFDDENKPFEVFDKVIVTTGGNPHRSNFTWIEGLGHKIEDPVPSLFTFNMPSEKITALMGVTIDKAIVRIQRTKLVSEGSLLITHWGMSGPAILKLSSFGARILSEMNYCFNIQVNWAGELNNEIISDKILEIQNLHPNKQLGNFRPFNLPLTLWTYLLAKLEIDEKKPWGELGKKSLNRLVNLLTNDVYHVEGRTTFRDEFVTCGGVSLESIDMTTMQSKACKNLYFAGEVMDIDAVTGGFNLQAAWTTGWIAGQLK
jgi:predicted Rossmann fold flavoprotein